MFDILKTAVKLPFTAAWDVASLGNMGDGSSTSRLLREHNARARVKEEIEVIKTMTELVRELKK